MVDEESWGLSFSFSSGSNQKRIRLGQKFIIGANLDFNRWLPSEKSGLNILQPVQNIIKNLQDLSNYRSSSEIIEDTLKKMPVSLNYLKENAKSRSVNTKGYRSVYLSNYIQINQKNVMLNPKESSNHVLIKLQDSHYLDLQKKLTENINSELAWRKKIQPILQDTLVIDDLQLQTFIQSICNQIASSYLIPSDYYPRCYVSASMVPNAYTYPGGYIFVTAGFIGLLKNFDALRFFMAHEMGHLLARHVSLNSENADFNKYIGYGLGFFADTMSILFGYGSFDGSGFLMDWVKPLSVQKVVGIGQSFFNLSIAASHMHFSRANESEADHLALLYADANGLSGTAIVEGFQDYQNLIVDLAKDQNLGFLDRLLDSHPRSMERIKSIQSFSISKNLQNSDAEIFAQYKKFHQNYKPGLAAWVLRNKIKQQLKTTSSEPERNLLKSLVQGCIY
jgi:Zn-dependent protease with chaperone function